MDYYRSTVISPKGKNSVRAYPYLRNAKNCIPSSWIIKFMLNESMTAETNKRHNWTNATINFPKKRHKIIKIIIVKRVFMRRTNISAIGITCTYWHLDESPNFMFSANDHFTGISTRILQCCLCVAFFQYFITRFYISVHCNISLKGSLGSVSFPFALAHTWGLFTGLEVWYQAEWPVNNALVNCFWAGF